MARVWDVNWFGSTKTLDVHIGWLRRKLGDDPADPALHRDRARRRLPLRRAGGRGAVSLRATLLLALAYVLLLALVALGVPLARQPARPRRLRGARPGAEPGRRGRGQRPGAARPRPARTLERLVGSRPRACAAG